MIGRDFPGINDPSHGLSEPERRAWAEGGAKGLIEQLTKPAKIEASTTPSLPPSKNPAVGAVSAPKEAIAAPVTVHEVQARLQKMEIMEFAGFLNEVSYAITRLMDDRRAAIARGMASDSFSAEYALKESRRADAADRSFRQSPVVQGLRLEVQRRFNQKYENGAHDYPGWSLVPEAKEAVKKISEYGGDRAKLAQYGITGKFVDGLDPAAVFIRDYRERS